jgi:hypothetical protein
MSRCLAQSGSELEMLVNISWGPSGMQSQTASTLSTTPALVCDPIEALVGSSSLPGSTWGLFTKGVLPRVDGMSIVIS